MEFGTAQFVGGRGRGQRGAPAAKSGQRAAGGQALHETAAGKRGKGAHGRKASGIKAPTPLPSCRRCSGPVRGSRRTPCPPCRSARRSGRACPRPATPRSPLRGACRGLSSSCRSAPSGRRRCPAPARGGSFPNCAR
ncbi:hypothetical protein G6F31_020901 [Rhizopus arrhizus]|nr:hypothetical protein G6F31_020901 [Rhizopus arrhizus]